MLRIACSRLLRKRVLLLKCQVNTLAFFFARDMRTVITVLNTILVEKRTVARIKLILRRVGNFNRMPVKYLMCKINTQRTGYIQRKQDYT